ncbi:MAG: LptE family protein [Bacteroidales bacterium]
MIHAAVLVLLAAGLFTSCKIQYSFTGASLTPEMKTVSVSFFPNRAPIVNPSLSQDFTEKLKDKFISQTSLQMISEGGDLHFEGEIRGYDTRPMAITGDERAALNRFSITIFVKFINEVDQTKNFESTFTAYEDFESDKGLDMVEGELIPLILEKIIEDIFNRAVVNW